MMNVILLLFVVIGVTAQNVARKAYSLKMNGGEITFSALVTVTALLIFVITSGGKLNFNPEIFGYAILFAISFGISTVALLPAIETGSLSLTSLIMSYSLIIPTLYGIIALGEEVKITLISGIIILLISLLLINIKKDEENKKISLKWVIYVSLVFAGNGMCSTVQKVQQIKFDGMYKNEFMIIALLIVLIVLFTVSLFKEKNIAGTVIKKGFFFYVFCGIDNSLVNLMTMIIATTMPASVSFPVISAGGIIMTASVSMFVYKEKFSKFKKAGFVLGITAIILLSI